MFRSWSLVYLKAAVLVLIGDANAFVGAAPASVSSSSDLEPFKSLLRSLTSSVTQGSPVDDQTSQDLDGLDAPGKASFLRLYFLIRPHLNPNARFFSDQKLANLRFPYPFEA